MSYPPPYDPNQAPPPPPPPYGAPAYQVSPIQPPKKSKAGLIVGIVIGVVLLLCVGCGGVAWYVFDWTGDKVQELEDALPSMGVVTGDGQGGPHQVRYSVQGSGEAMITFSQGTGGTKSETVSLPWSTDLTVDSESFGLSVIVFGTGGSTDVEGCSIQIDGKVEEENKGTGNTVVCTALFVGS